MTLKLSFDVAGQGPLTVAIEHLVIAGWTGRDRTAVDHHIAELQAIGVAPPTSVPLFYRVGASLLGASGAIETVGATGSGEVEPMLLDDGFELYLGLGSDHTDRELEAHSVALSKQICPKPIAALLWRFDEVRDHIDDLELKSWIREDDAVDWTPYQAGTVAKIRTLTDLVAACPLSAGPDRLQAGTAMMCGTLGVLSGGVRPARYFRMSMHDPVLGRTIEHSYQCHNLPVVA